jgi:hypothetical protein
MIKASVPRVLSLFLNLQHDPKSGVLLHLLRPTPHVLKMKANKGKAPLEEPSKKAQANKSLELLSLVSSTKSNFVAMTFGEPRSSTVAPKLVSSKDVDPL